MVFSRVEGSRLADAELAESQNSVMRSEKS